MDSKNLLQDAKNYGKVGIWGIAIISVSYSLLSITSALSAPTGPTAYQLAEKTFTEQKQLLQKAHADTEAARKLVTEKEYAECQQTAKTQLAGLNFGAQGGNVDDLEGMKRRYALTSCPNPFQQPSEAK